mgnify:CR=1 FL=1
MVKCQNQNLEADFKDKENNYLENIEELKRTIEELEEKINEQKKQLNRYKLDIDNEKSMRTTLDTFKLTL